MKNNNFILLVGKSGSGKTTVANELYRRYGLSQVDSYTTRQPRVKNEVGHIFIDDEQFDIIMDDFVAYTEFDGNRYGATSCQVEDNQIYVIDIDGVNYFTESYCGNKKSIVVYLDVPENICFDRICKRNSVHEANKRLENDRIAFKDAKQMSDYIVENISLDNCVKEIYNIWKKG